MAGKRAVVFSGGGAKGGYQIGAWQALRELNFSPNIVTGTSVGAFNGALMASDKYEEALNIWENMSMGMVFSQFAEAVNNEESKQDDFIKALIIKVNDILLVSSPWKELTCSEKE